MKEFRTLKLAMEQYQKIKNLELKGEIRDQIERAALSVCLNLSEGNARLYKKDRRRFFNISFASQKEVQMVMCLQGLVGLMGPADKLAAHLFKLQMNTQ